MIDYGIKVSSGNNILTAQEADIVFSSNRNMLKTFRAEVAKSAEFAHGLSYAPIIFPSTNGLIGYKNTTYDDVNNIFSGIGIRYYSFYQQAN